MRSRIAYMMAVGCLLLVVCVSWAQIAAPAGTISNKTIVEKKGGGTFALPKGEFELVANTIDPKLEVVYGYVDNGVYTPIGGVVKGTPAKKADGTYTWTAPDLGPLTAGKTYKVNVTLYGKKGGMPPGQEKELSQSSVQFTAP